MYKAFIFDFDGVLVDTTDIQVRSIVRALGRNGFDVRHPSDLDIVHSTITTKAKLVKFCDKGYINMDQVETIYEDKKRIANELMLELNPKHYFCKMCGIHTHNLRRADPNTFGINIACLDGIDPQEIFKLDVGINDGHNHIMDQKK